MTIKCFHICQIRAWCAPKTTNTHIKKISTTSVAEKLKYSQMMSFCKTFP